MERTIDVLVIGGGAAGSAAALQLARVRRGVVVIDSGEPRNAPAAHMQGYLGHDGLPPAEFTAIAHAELATYGVTVSSGRVTSVVDGGDAMVCTTDGGDVYRARRVVLATGLTDQFPDIDGVRERWGDTVIHCPWCHGWEVRDRRIVVIDTTGMGSHQALIFAQLSDRVTLVRNHEPALSEAEVERLELANVVVEPRPATHITSDGDHMAIHLDGATATPRTITPRAIDADVAVVAPRFEPNVDMVDGLVALIDVADHPSGLGRHVVVDDFGTTSHPKVFAVGNVADPMQQVLHAAAHGSKAATMLNTGLIEDDTERARNTAVRIDWDEMYEANDQHWSGKPNGSLVVEASRLDPGRALDVGCGEGADAIWLAQQGWTVVGTDISEVAVGRARAAAESLDVDVEFVAVDTSTGSAQAGAFDLVALSYPAFEVGIGAAAIESIARSVGDGGVLFVVGHVHDDASRERAREHGFDLDAFVSIDDIIDAVRGDFDIVTDEQRERPDAPDGAHHSVDRVLVARRRAAR